MRILKFGGKSLATTKKTQKICKYIKKIYKNDKKLIIVVSAMGNTTNNLIRKVSRFPENKQSKRELDVLLSTGETSSSAIFAIILNSIGIPAKSLQSFQIKIKTRGEHQSSLITSINKKKIDSLLNKNIVCIIPGFQGINSAGDITTLGRGGSDTTASALGAVYDTTVELYSDFDGMFSGDPRQLNYKKQAKVSIQGLDRITANGSKIVSNRAVKIAKKNNLTLLLKKSSEPNKVGSIVSPIETNNISIITKDNLCEVTIDFDNNFKLYFYAKNVILWLINYKLYNFNVNNNKITIIIDAQSKTEILKILGEKLKLLNS